MTDSNQIIYSLEGPSKTDGHVELPVFAAKVVKFHKLLTEVAKDLNESGVEFHIVDASHTSPLTIAFALAGAQLLDSHIIRHMQKGFDAVKVGKTEHLRNNFLSALENFTKSYSKKIAWEEVSFVADSGKIVAYLLDDRFRKNLKELCVRNVESSCISTVDGRLEQVDIHVNPHKFTIYNSIFSVGVKFPDDLTAKVQKALGRHVSVSGKCSYKPGESFPHVIDVHKMEILSSSSELPSFEDIYGILPALPGGKSSEDFVRELRDQWGERDKKLYGDR